MLGLVVDLDLWMIGSHMTLTARIGRARLSLGETMATMAGRAGTTGSIRIDPADAGVGPGARSGFPIIANFHYD